MSLHILPFKKKKTGKSVASEWPQGKPEMLVFVIKEMEADRVMPTMDKMNSCS